MNLPSDFVNDAGILASDKPADVVRKLNAAALRARSDQTNSQASLRSDPNDGKTNPSV